MNEDEMIVNDWIEFIGPAGNYINVRRDSINAVVQYNTCETELLLKDGFKIHVKSKYEDVMKMV